MMAGSTLRVPSINRYSVLLALTNRVLRWLGYVENITFFIISPRFELAEPLIG
jgi:hypothetical protein